MREVLFAVQEGVAVEVDVSVVAGRVGGREGGREGGEGREGSRCNTHVACGRCQ